MAGPYCFSPSRAPIIFTFICFISLLSAQDCKKRTLESCESDESCAASLRCLGRTSDGEIGLCPNPGIPNCLCAPLGAFVDCNKDSDCPQLEGCAVSPRSGRKICTGCGLIVDKSKNYVSADPSSNKCSQPAPPCGRTLDFCSGDFPCFSPLQCIDSNQGRNFLCGDNGPCKCEPPQSQPLQSCASRSDCPARETCAEDTRTGVLKCISCDVAQNDFNYIVKPGDVCNGVAPRPNPSYPPSSNGLTFDLCASDLMCQGGRTCKQFIDISAPLDGVKPCSSRNELCFCHSGVKSCENSYDCPTGEVCADADRIGVFKGCVSAALLATIPKDEFNIRGQRPVPDGFGRTGQKCKFDWECKSPRRCTHMADTYGDCAGREACTCEPLFRQVCSTDSDCPTAGERCVNYIDGLTQPFCIFEQAANQDPSLKAPGFKRSTSNKIPGNGNTLDPCRDDTDCKGSRTCQHRNEERRSCNNRELCVCKPSTFKKCKKSADCGSFMEVCALIKDSIPATGMCTSRRVVNDNANNLVEINPRLPLKRSISSSNMKAWNNKRKWMRMPSRRA